jgi:hypothetical protein
MDFAVLLSSACANPKPVASIKMEYTVAPLPTRILNENLNSTAERIITMWLILTRLL